MVKVKKCPKCGSTNMKWDKKGDLGFYECDACGYKGSVVDEEDLEDNPEINF